MKFFRHSFLLLLLLTSMIFGSCESKTKQMKSLSPDGKAEIILHGNKSSMEPWKLQIELKHDGKSTKMGEVEMYAGEISNENVLFIWNNDRQCTLKLVEQDDVTREIPVVF